jgi:hypothetical protein
MFSLLGYSCESFVEWIALEHSAATGTFSAPIPPFQSNLIL